MRMVAHLARQLASSHHLHSGSQTGMTSMHSINALARLFKLNFHLRVCRETSSKAGQHWTPRRYGTCLVYFIGLSCLISSARQLWAFRPTQLTSSCSLTCMALPVSASNNQLRVLFHERAANKLANEEVMLDVSTCC